MFLISLKKLSLMAVFPAGQKIGTIFCPKGGLAVATIIILYCEG
jgi:hypothetical protein